MSTLNTDDKTLSHAEDLASEVERLTARIAELEAMIPKAEIEESDLDGIPVFQVKGRQARFFITGHEVDFNGMVSVGHESFADFTAIIIAINERLKRDFAKEK